MFWKRYNRRKGKQLLLSTRLLLHKKKHKISEEGANHLKGELEELDSALKSRDRKRIKAASKQVDETSRQLFPKSLLDYSREIIIAIVLALLVATVVRQMWFEPMEIPSGSMRPTYEELDRLVVSKDTFGLNIPMMPAHLMFNPDATKRTGVFIFTSEDMDIADQDTTYFGFPGKRRLIKRMMGKPGDTLYFYGGKVWGIDKEGEDIKELREIDLEYIPFITFEGKVSDSPQRFRQFNQVIGRITKNGGEIYNGKEWIPDDPAKTDGLNTYSDFYGMGNFAMARLLTGKELASFSEAQLDDLGEGMLYLELRHHPSLTYPKPHLGRDAKGQVRPMLTPEVSVIPLSKNHIDRIQDTLYTSRFYVENGRAYADRPGLNKQMRQSPYLPRFPGVPDGRYEFYHGIGYEVAFGGILKQLPKDHPLYKKEYIQRLFNLGVEFLTPYAPQGRNQLFYPSRYAYFLDGDLYLMGGLILHKSDPVLKAFNQKEEERKERSTKSRPYRPFIDAGRPTREVIETYGLKLPEKGYLALGDNHAGSGDSRVFGFVPEDNIRGTPSFIVWPPGPRWGTTAKPPYPWFTLPRLIVWVVFIAICLLVYFYKRHRDKRLDI